MSSANYATQLGNVEAALKVTTDPTERSTLMGLKNDLMQLIALTNDGEDNNDPMDDEYTQFMTEMIDEGAIDLEQDEIEETKLDQEEIRDSLKDIEGMKCRAPHTHSWGAVVYHNAMVCSTVTENFNPNKIMVKVLFTNPTHKEMIPCPFYLETDCKFTEDKCHYSHGNVVEFSLLQDYTNPDFSKLEVGSKVLAKKSDKLWHRAKVRRLFENNKCIVKFENSSGKDVEIDLSDVLPLTDSDATSSEDELDSDIETEEDQSDIINTSLLITPSSQALGEWEKYTRGIGSKLMRNMGYIVGSGLGKLGEGIVDPVSAIVLPKGKSLDHCMTLREYAGGDKNLFSAERKLKRIQKREEKRSEKLYEREKKKTDVFKVINSVLEYPHDVTAAGSSTSVHRSHIRKETTRSLNVESLKIEESLKQAEKNLWQVNDRLRHHNDTNSQLHKALSAKKCQIMNDINDLKTKFCNIKNEQSNRSDKKKLTIF